MTARIAPDSRIGILAHTTSEEFQAKVPASDLAGRTYNPVPAAGRWARSKFLPRGKARTRAVD